MKCWHLLTTWVFYAPEFAINMGCHYVTTRKLLFSAGSDIVPYRKRQNMTGLSFMVLQKGLKYYMV